ncbi:Ig-like domain-containing protein, partial [Candidatus Marinamargulisbacteria bacterium]|nr:Ig-like domain-containing protein [Candidatus Marinamargulisbacteria bacterium]
NQTIIQLVYGNNQVGTVNPDAVVSLSTTVNTALTIATSDLMSIGAYINDPTTINIVSLPQNGVLNVGDNSIYAGDSFALSGLTYTPNSGFVGSDSFVYRLENNAGDSVYVQAGIAVVDVLSDDPPTEYDYYILNTTKRDGSAFTEHDGYLYTQSKRISNLTGNVTVASFPISNYLDSDYPNNSRQFAMDDSGALYYTSNKVSGGVFRVGHFHDMVQSYLNNELDGDTLETQVRENTQQVATILNDSHLYNLLTMTSHGHLVVAQQRDAFNYIYVIPNVANVATGSHKLRRLRSPGLPDPIGLDQGNAKFIRHIETDSFGGIYVASNEQVVRYQIPENIDNNSDELVVTGGVLIDTSNKTNYPDFKIDRSHSPMSVDSLGYVYVFVYSRNNQDGLVDYDSIAL